MNNGILAEARRLVTGEQWSPKQILTANQTANLSTSYHGVATTSSGVANTKTSWADLVASTPYDCCILVVSITGEQSAGSSNAISVDIATGGSGSEVVLIDNILQYGKARCKYWWFPIRVAAGTRLAYRYQTERTSVEVVVGATLVPDIPEFPAGTSVVTIGAGLGAGSGIDGFTWPTNGGRKIWQQVGSFSGQLLWALPNPGIRSNQNFITSSVAYLADFGWIAGDTGASYNGTTPPPDTIWARDVFWLTDTTESQCWSAMPVYLDPPLNSGTMVVAGDVASGGNAGQHGPNVYGIVK